MKRSTLVVFVLLAMGSATAQASGPSRPAQKPTENELGTSLGEVVLMLNHPVGWKGRIAWWLFEEFGERVGVLQTRIPQEYLTLPAPRYLHHSPQYFPVTGTSVLKNRSDDIRR
jgi:hypothetical protein